MMMEPRAISFILAHCMKYPREDHQYFRLMKTGSHPSVTTEFLSPSVLVQYDKENIYAILFDHDKSTMLPSEYKRVRRWFREHKKEIKCVVLDKFKKIVGI